MKRSLWPAPRRVGIALLLAALAFSIMANVKLWRLVNGLERAAARQALDPIGLEVFASDRAAATRPAGRRLVMFGDSRVVTWPVLVVPGLEYVNRGIGGQSTAQLVLRYPVDVAPLQPSVVLVQAGVNDLTKLAQFPEERASILRQCKANLARLVTLARADSSRVLLTTIFPRSSAARGGRAAPVDAAIAEVNAYIRTLAGPGVRVLDVVPLLVGPDGGVRPEFADDSVHLNAAGYEAISRSVLQELELLKADLAAAPTGTPEVP
ncbi:SGNH/GDSL hydrolase family protein [Roseisolibacter agri]|uniref:Lipase n=1 Tax=Roseisolibacter agri TaxID=2014610 RepID=A0AA37Q9F9_9BACT|nr:GDSL-type esterase/lipase family protein [Roseisolibacter agri]GLC25531.1 lipase [Roseisolibacter agri]